MASVFHVHAAYQPLNPFQQCVYIVSKLTGGVLTNNEDGNVVCKPRSQNNDMQLWYLQLYGNGQFTINAYSAAATAMSCSQGLINEIIELKTLSPAQDQLWQYDGDHITTCQNTSGVSVFGVNSSSTSNRVTLVRKDDASQPDQCFSFDPVPSYWCITNSNYPAGLVLEASDGVVNHETKDSTGNNQLWYFDNNLKDGTFQIRLYGSSQQYAAYGDGFEVHVIGSDPAYTTIWKGTPDGYICTTTGTLRYLQASLNAGAVYVNADQAMDTLIFTLEKFTAPSLIVGKETSV